MIQLYNTLTKKRERLPKLKKGKPLRLFVCGPTVYDYSHIGHARVYLTFDMLARYLRYKKQPVFYLQNITDIDDKIIDRAHQSKQKPAQVAKQFEKAYYEDMKALDVSSVTKYAPASQFIKEIIVQIKKLIKKKFAYKISSGVYFRVKKFKNYGQLSKQDLNELRPGYRTEPDPEKEDVFDFGLWKLKKQKWEPSWSSPWGTGRPGWHIEDTAISEKFFGPQYDIHGAAADLKFPHHEAEIAQQESASGKKPFVKLWVHTGFLTVEGKKMSKSLGNFITIRSYLKKFSPESLRFIALSHYYRSPIDYQEDLARQAERALMNLRNFLVRLELMQEEGKSGLNVTGLTKSAEKNFEAALADDFNTPDAISALFFLINQMEPMVWDLRKDEAQFVKRFLMKKFAIFGIQMEKFLAIPPKIQELLKQRELYRTSKQFVQSDALRKQMDALGYLIEDTRKGPLLYSKRLTTND
ncbi:MAG: cysteine--tRNA ligase [bacterium]|nr:cysteine--tRNA ligase [bacterium]